MELRSRSSQSTAFAFAGWLWAILKHRLPRSRTSLVSASSRPAGVAGVSGRKSVAAVSIARGARGATIRASVRAEAAVRHGWLAQPAMG